jgi:hypothetical protein
VARLEWTDERLDERMAAIDQTFERIFEELALIRGEIGALRADFAQLQDRLIQIGFGLVLALIAAIVTIVLALA